MSFKPKTTKRIGDMDFGDAEDALKLAEWRVEHPGANVKYQAKNKAEAEEDVRQLQAFLQTDDFGGTVNLPEPDGEPPF